MILGKVKDVSNPIVYIFLTLFISCICYKFYDDYRRLAIFIAVFFFIVLFYYCGIHFSILMIIFFIIGVCINNEYYYVPNEINDTVRIKQIKSYNIIADLNGKKVVLNSTDGNLQIAKKYIIKGKIKNNIDKQNGIVGEIDVNEFIPVEDDLLSKIFEVKIKVYELLKENLGQRKSSLISSISFGYKDYLDEEDESDMKSFGIIHSISVSGLHVAIVYAFLKKIIGSKIGLLGTILYVILTGSEYSSIRAFIMLATIEGANIFKKNNNSLSSISLSGIIVFILTPYAIFQISFHLSYLATAGIILFNKKLNEKLYKVPDKIRESLCITLSAQIFTTPYLMIIFKDFSLNFILGNLFLVPFINIIVIAGNLLILTYWCTPMFDFICYLMLKLVNVFDYLVNQFERFTLPMFYGNEYIAFFYSILLFSFYFFYKGYKKFVYLPIISILIILVQMYNPIPCIKYYREGAIVISNKGKNILITNKNPIDIQRLSKISYATHLYRDIKQVSIENICQIEANGQNYILSVNNEKYFLKLSGNNYGVEDYDIINFKEGKITKLVIFDDKIYKVF